MIKTQPLKLKAENNSSEQTQAPTEIQGSVGESQGHQGLDTSQVGFWSRWAGVAGGDSHPEVDENGVS